MCVHREVKKEIRMNHLLKLCGFRVCSDVYLILSAHTFLICKNAGQILQEQTIQQVFTSAFSKLDRKYNSYSI